jgi:hypothetical protein
MTANSQLRRIGVSMLEVMIGTIILVLALIPLFGLSIQHTRGVGISIDEIDAASYATSLLEAMQIVPITLLDPVEQDGGVPLSELSSSLTDHLHMPADPTGRFLLSVNILSRTADPGIDISSLPASVATRLHQQLEMRVLEVYCNFSTRGLQGGNSSRRRARQIKLVTIVSQGARGF